MTGSEKIARYSFLGFDPCHTFKVKDGLIGSVSREAHVRIDPSNGHPILAACCFGSDSRFDICDLMDYDNLMDAWNHPKLQAIRQAHIDCMNTGTTDPLKGTMCEMRGLLSPHHPSAG